MTRDLGHETRQGPKACMQPATEWLKEGEKADFPDFTGRILL